MRRIAGLRRATALGAALLGLAILVAGCSRGRGFGIHLLRAPYPDWGSVEIDLGQLGYEAEPVIGLDDIRWYDATTHEFELTDEAMDRVRELSVPVAGLPFVVRVGDEPIYAGAFMTPISSFAFPGVMIMQPFGEIDTLQVELGYPSPAMYRGDDPRGDPRILHALRDARKLR